MRRRILTGLSLAAGVLFALWLDHFVPGVIAWLFGALAGGLVAWELARMGEFRELGLGRALAGGLLATAVASALLAYRLALEPPAAGSAGLLDDYALLVGAALAGALLGGLFRAPPDTQPGAPLRPALLQAVWAFPPLFALALYDLVFGVWALGALIVLSKIGDNFGYFVGRSIGRSHPFSTISPNKTTAGCVASLGGGIATGLAFAALGGLPAGRYGLLGAALFGGLVNLGAQAGDLIESVVKRRAGVKDSSGLVGASGGVLDVVDSLLVAVPVGLAVWPWLFPALD